MRNYIINNAANDKNQLFPYFMEGKLYQLSNVSLYFNEDTGVSPRCRVIKLVPRSSVLMFLGVYELACAFVLPHICADAHQIKERGYHFLNGQDAKRVFLVEGPGMTIGGLANPELYLKRIS